MVIKSVMQAKIKTSLSSVISRLCSVCYLPRVPSLLKLNHSLIQVLWCLFLSVASKKSVPCFRKES